MRAEAVVLAVPAPLAANLAGDLPAVTLEALRAVRYGPYVVGAFLIDAGTAAPPWDGVYAVATPGRSFSVIYDIGSVQRNPGLPRPAYTSLMVYTAAAQARRLLR